MDSYFFNLIFFSSLCLRHMGSQFPSPGIKPHPTLEAQCLNHWAARRSMILISMLWAITNMAFFIFIAQLFLLHLARLSDVSLIPSISLVIFFESAFLHFCIMKLPHLVPFPLSLSPITSSSLEPSTLYWRIVLGIKIWAPWMALLLRCCFWADRAWKCFFPPKLLHLAFISAESLK